MTMQKKSACLNLRSTKSLLATIYEALKVYLQKITRQQIPVFFSIQIVEMVHISLSFKGNPHEVQSYYNRLYLGYTHISKQAQEVFKDFFPRDYSITKF